MLTAYIVFAVIGVCMGIIPIVGTVFSGLILGHICAGEIRLGVLMSNRQLILASIIGFGFGSLIPNTFYFGLSMGSKIVILSIILFWVAYAWTRYKAK